MKMVIFIQCNYKFRSYYEGKILSGIRKIYQRGAYS